MSTFCDLNLQLIPRLASLLLVVQELHPSGWLINRVMLAVFPSHPCLNKRNISVVMDHPRERVPGVQEGGQRRGNREWWSDETWMENNGLGKETGPGCWWTVTWNVMGGEQERLRKDRSGLWAGWEGM